MENIYILCVDDQRDVLTTIVKDLSKLSEFVNIEECQSASEAYELMEEIDVNGGYIAVIVCDHVMPEKDGVTFLSEIHHDSRFKDTFKILLTGMASHKDTINAINEGGVSNYFEKPWDSKKLIDKIRELTTKFILKKGFDYSESKEFLDNNVLIEHLKNSY